MSKDNPTNICGASQPIATAQRPPERSLNAKESKSRQAATPQAKPGRSTRCSPPEGRATSTLPRPPNPAASPRSLEMNNVSAAAPAGQVANSEANEFNDAAVIPILVGMVAGLVVGSIGCVVYADLWNNKHSTINCDVENICAHRPAWPFICLILGFAAGGVAFGVIYAAQTGQLWIRADEAARIRNAMERRRAWNREHTGDALTRSGARHVFARSPIAAQNAVNQMITGMAANNAQQNYYANVIQGNNYN